MPDEQAFKRSQEKQSIKSDAKSATCFSPPNTWQNLPRVFHTTHMILQDLHVLEIRRDLAFMREYACAVNEVRVCEMGGNIIYSLGNPDASSFLDIIYKASVVDPTQALMPCMFSGAFQILDRKYPNVVIDERRQYLRTRVDSLLSVVYGTTKSDMLGSAMAHWSTTPMSQVRQLWRDELRARCAC